MRTTLIKSSINVLDLVEEWPNTEIKKIIPELTNIIKDPTFDPIRDEPAFINLMEEYDRNAAEQRQLLQAMNEG